MKLLYSKLEKRRKPQFLLGTKIYESTRGKFVRKYAADQRARKHLKDLYSRTKTFARLCDFLSFPAIYDRQSSRIDFEYIPHPSLAKSIQQALINRDYKLALSYLKKMNDFVNRFTSTYENPYLSPEFIKRFDPPRSYNFEENEKCVSNTPLDFSFDNVLSKDGEHFVIDIEWLYDFPIPIHYIAFRSLYYLCIFLQPLLQARASLAFPCYEIMEKVYIPIAWLKLCPCTEDEIRRFLTYEKNFQNYVLVTKNEFDSRLVLNKMRVRGPFYLEYIHHLGKFISQMP